MKNCGTLFSEDYRMLKKKVLPGIIIAIDGHSACGKSTLAKELSSVFGYTYIDTGAMYRAVALFFIRENIDLDVQQEVVSGLNRIKLEFVIEKGKNCMFLNGENVEEEIRKMYVSNQVSQVAELSVVRKMLVDQQQKMGLKKGVVLDGRDIGTVVFPDAELKLFITASVAVRTQRRYLELKEKGQAVDIASVQANLLKRDQIDSGRKDSPLKQAEDAVLIDNTNLSRKEQLAMVEALARLRMKDRLTEK